MFTSDSRQALLNRIADLAVAMPTVSGAVLVGSGATGFTDGYSDLDMVLVAVDGASVPIIAAQFARELEDTEQVLSHSRYEHQPEIWVDCFLLADLLEVDVGIWSLEQLRATKPVWRVLFDRSGKVAKPS